MEKSGTICKRHMVKEIKEKLETCPSFFIVNFQGLSMLKIEALRNRLRPSLTDFTIVRNSLFKKAIGNKSYQQLQDLLTQTSAVCFNKKDPFLCSKILSNFAKENDGFKIRGGILEGEFITEGQLKELALLGSKEELIAQIIRVINGPMLGLLSSLGALTRKLVFCLDAIVKKRSS